VSKKGKKSYLKFIIPELISEFMTIGYFPQFWYKTGALVRYNKDKLILDLSEIAFDKLIPKSYTSKFLKFVRPATELMANIDLTESTPFCCASMLPTKEKDRVIKNNLKFINIILK
jgi:hypothetical protein